MLVELHGQDAENERRDSPAKCIGAIPTVITGRPEAEHISTSYTITIEDQSARGVVRWVQKLDGSESRNVIRQAKPPMEYVQVSTTTWDGDSLVTRTSERNGSAPFVLTTVARLEGATLVILATQTSEAAGAVQKQYTYRCSK